MKPICKTISWGVAVLCAAVPVSSFAASISFSNFNSNFEVLLPVVDSNGVLLPNNGGYAAIGYFSTLTDIEIANSNSSLSAFDGLKNDFEIFGSDINFGGTSAFNTSGLFKGDITGPINAGSSFIGEDIYAFIGNSDTLAASTELLVFRADTQFAEDNPVFAYTFDISDGSGTLILGQAGPTIDVGNGSGPSLQTVGVVPEPSTYAALAGLCVLGYVMVRRRK